MSLRAVTRKAATSSAVIGLVVAWVHGAAALAVAQPRAAEFARVADAGTEAMYQRGQQYYDARQFGTALQYFQAAARGGDARAQNMLGNMYGSGQGVQRNFAQAAYWYGQSAAQGNRWGEYSLGLIYMQGLGGLPNDQARAARLFQASAEQGLVAAEGELGLAYEFGQGVPRSRQMALYWLDKAAPQWGRAHWIADWLRRPDTPQFQSMGQLDAYINSRVARTNGPGRGTGGVPSLPHNVWNGQGYGPANPVTGAPCHPSAHDC
jgi:TPR repeat protein